MKPNTGWGAGICWRVRSSSPRAGDTFGGGVETMSTRPWSRAWSRRSMNNVNSMAANLTTILVASGLVLLARPGSAQQPDSAAHGLGSLKALSVEQLMGVEVTSVSKRAERLLEAPAAVQVITQEEIRRSGVTSLPE